MAKFRIVLHIPQPHRDNQIHLRITSLRKVVLLRQLPSSSFFQGTTPSSFVPFPVSFDPVAFGLYKRKSISEFSRVTLPAGYHHGLLTSLDILVWAARIVFLHQL